MEMAEDTIAEQRLAKTSAEQTLLRSIQELETELHSTSEHNRRSELSEQISGLKDELMRVQGPDYAELERENRGLKALAKQLQSKLDEICSSSNGAICDTASSDAKDLNLRERLYALLLERYGKTISDLEKKTVGQIKALVSDEDLSVQSLVAGFKPENYSFDANYLDAARSAFEFITKQIDYVDVELDLNFWLTPKEILSHKIGDDEDLAILLCSILYTLGDRSAEVVIAELDNLKTHAFVITKHSGNFLLLDPSQGRHFDKFTGKREQVLRSYSFRGARIKRFLYRFNHEKYEQFL